MYFDIIYVLMTVVADTKSSQFLFLNITYSYCLFLD